MNDGSILMAPVSSTYLGTTVPWALTVVAASLGSARVGSDTAYKASPPLRRLMALSSPATIELTGPPYTSAAAGLPSAVVPFWTLRPRAPSAMEPRVTTTATTVTRIKSIFQRYSIWPASRPIRANMRMPKGTSARGSRMPARMPTKAPASSSR